MEAPERIFSILWYSNAFIGRYIKRTDADVTLIFIAITQVVSAFGGGNYAGDAERCRFVRLRDDETTPLDRPPHPGDSSDRTVSAFSDVPICYQLSMSDEARVD